MHGDEPAHDWQAKACALFGCINGVAVQLCAISLLSSGIIDDRLV